MSFNVVTSSYRLVRKRRSALQEALRIGVLAGLSAVAFALIGAYVLMDKRFIVEDTLTLSQIVLAVTACVAGYCGAKAADEIGLSKAPIFAWGAVAGLIAAICLILMLVLVATTNIRTILVAASPMLLNVMSFGFARASWQCFAGILAGALVFALAGAGLTQLGRNLRRAILTGLATALIAGLFRDVLVAMIQNLPGGASLARAAFGSMGLNPLTCGILVVAATLISYMKSRRPASPRNGHSRLGLAALLVAVLLLPMITSDFVAQIAMLVALYMLMGMGLNIELGLAGLVDLGFVAFFAVGAYTIALLCSDGPLAIADISFWLAMPIAVGLAATAGFLFGLPVLRVRGDYLAMATLGLGEIVRVLVLSDALAPILGGSQGMIGIKRPMLGDIVLNQPTELYYLALALAAVVAFISWRLQRSRIGRAWLAIREDEDVAQALGIDPVASKLVAYTVGAAFAGAAGAVFAVLIGSVFPSSFQLLVSINVLAILVIGGLGSLPGVLVGAAVLIGLPELLREFGEFRYLFYGLALVVMMHVRAEGLWPVKVASAGKGVAHG
ncbi:branched-chain amino acid ABC transporter permease [Rhizobium lusitanum]|uniref:branched-chain amino acid ABC transporter permease n=1 Tax=Rhizobium lusitanum TaxID=293958 RepID=UPI00195A7A03|nr:branched-chain amino acid ABC transporter permease [Rhizobium lusitanum]MBM7044713.1 branched-chain amino acid ABC transporter permease [Rhizobium lusitanum]